MKIAYFDTGSGISGDMTVGALLDVGGKRGLTLERLTDALALLEVGGYRLAAEATDVGTIRANSFSVVIDEPPHLHRDWQTIRRLIEDAGGRGLSDGTVSRAVRVFEVLAEAEARVHGVTPEEVHFHEVGAIDSIVDIVGAAWCLDTLNVEACFVGPLPSGSGYVQTEHGRLPVPAPATAVLMEGFDIIAGDGEGELVTPTGMAILAGLAKPMRPGFTVESIGVGAGTKRLQDRPNVLRVMLGECDAVDDAQVVEIVADIDDMTPEALAHVAQRLRADGARDVNVEPVHMKKGRSGMRLTVLCDVERLSALADRALSETSSIGLRYRMLNRVVLPRRIEQVETEYGTIAVKIVARPDGRETAEPEFDDVARIALDRDLPFKQIRAAALQALDGGDGGVGPR
jgi:uncharacterized protein (TIGR00299 family) protein